MWLNRMTSKMRLLPCLAGGVIQPSAILKALHMLQAAVKIHVQPKRVALIAGFFSLQWHAVAKPTR